MKTPELTTTHKNVVPIPFLHPPVAVEARDGDALVARLAEEMVEAWRQGKRPCVEEYLERHPDLRAQPAAIADLLYEEICLRHQHAEPVELADLVQRFPGWQPQIEILLNCASALETGIVGGYPTTGHALGDFVLLAELGRGGQGRVFAATQTSLGDRPVVLKITSRSGKEHLALARLQHTHIVPLLSVVDDPARNMRVICMPYFGGLSLAAILETLKDQPLDGRTGQHILDVLDQARAQAAIALPASRDPATPFLQRATYVQALSWLGACLAEALKYAHERVLVHLDLKPSNVLLTADRQPMLLDFHLARAPLAPGDPGAHFGGTPAYMSPEQKRAMAALRAWGTVAEAVDGRSDIYSLGLLLYEALGGALTEDQQTPRKPLHRCNPQVSPGLSDIIARCLSPNVSTRYQDAGALARDLWNHLNDMPLQGVANRSLGERWQKWRRRQPHMLFMGALVAVVLAVAGAALTLVVEHAGHRLEEAQSALADGRKYLLHGQNADAISTLKRGLSQLEALPGHHDLKSKLTARLHLATRALMAQELHRIADQFRLLYGVEDYAQSRLATLEVHCRAFWDRRNHILDKLGDELEPAIEQRVQLDLLDLAILGSNLRIRLADPGHVDAARDEALRVLAQAETLFGPTAVLYHERASHARAMGHLELARAAEARAAQCPPRTAWEHYALGRSLLAEGHVENAATQFEQAVTKDRGGLWSNFYHGVCSYRLRRFDDATVAFTVCTTLAPELAGCFCNRALAFAGQGRTDRALRDFDRALELDPDLAEAALQRGLLHFQERRLAQAASDLHLALRNGARPAIAHYHLAHVAIAQNDRAAALTHLQRSQGFDTGNADVARLLKSLQE